MHIKARKEGIVLSEDFIIGILLSYLFGGYYGKSFHYRINLLGDLLPTSHHISQPSLRKREFDSETISNCNGMISNIPNRYEKTLSPNITNQKKTTMTGTKTKSSSSSSSSIIPKTNISNKPLNISNINQPSIQHTRSSSVCRRLLPPRLATFLGCPSQPSGSYGEWGDWHPVVL